MGHKEKLATMINEANDHYKLHKSQFDHYYVEPMPKREALEHHYREKYYSDLKRASNKGMHMDAEEASFQLTYYEIKQFIKQHVCKSQPAILDVGCGSGLFLQQLFEDNYQKLAGTDFSRQFQSEEIEFFAGDFLEINFSQKYDFIMLNNVLEHVPDPGGFLKKSYTLLNKGGVVRIQVPNDLSLTQYQFLIQQENPLFYFFSPKEHLHYFDFDSMQTILEHHQFKLIKKTTNWCMDLFLLMGLDYSNDPAVGKQCHDYRNNLEKKMDKDQMLAFYEKLSELSIGRVVVEYAKK